MTVLCPSDTTQSLRSKAMMVNFLLIKTLELIHVRAAHMKERQRFVCETHKYFFGKKEYQYYTMCDCAWWWKVVIALLAVTMLFVLYMTVGSTANFQNGPCTFDLDGICDFKNHW